MDDYESNQVRRLRGMRPHEEDSNKLAVYSPLFCTLEQALHLFSKVQLRRPLFGAYTFHVKGEDYGTVIKLTVEGFGDDVHTGKRVRLSMDNYLNLTEFWSVARVRGADAAAEYVAKCLRAFTRHEIDEHLTVNGKLRKDPHPKG